MRSRHLPVFVVLGLVAWLLVAGCGEKIAIPEPEGLFSVAPYLPDTTFTDDDPRQLITLQGSLFVINRSTLAKRDQNYNLVAEVTGLADPTALCSDDGDSLVFVWDDGLKRVTWYLARNLTSPLGNADLPVVQSCAGMATSLAGVEQVPGAVTFLYLADPDSGVVHRYAYDPYSGLIPHGILCRSDGDGTRFVHDAAGMVRDDDDHLLVCDRDLMRNWVIRFSSEPDTTDVAADPGGVDPLRGTAALFSSATGNPPPAADYVLGNAAEAGEDDWVGGPSEAPSEFTEPLSVAVDGSARIFVADSGNDRVQIFSHDGVYERYYGSNDVMPQPVSLDVVDVRVGAGADDIRYAAFMFVITGDGLVRKFISGEHHSGGGLPPPP